MSDASLNFLSLRKQYEQDGYVIVRRFLDEAELAELTRELKRYITQVVPQLPDSDAFYADKSHPESLKQMQHMGHDAFFQSYRSHARWNELATALIGEECSAQEPEWFNKPPGFHHETPPHQDNFYFCLKPPHVATLWLALDRVDTENGCLRYVPGSHHRGIRPHGRTQVLGFSQGILDYGAADRDSEVIVELEPGDLVAHHGELIHRADANQSSDRNRRAFAMVFRGMSCRRDDSAYERYLDALNSQHAQLGLGKS